MSVKRGEIYWVEFDPVKGSEQSGLRPALVVQNDTGNMHSPTTIVVAMTRSIPPRRYPFIVTVSPEESGLPEPGVINCAQLATVQQEGPDSRLRPPRSETVLRPIGQLSAEKMAEVERALCYSLSIRSA